MCLAQPGGGCSMSRSVSFDDPPQPPAPQEEQPDDPARNGLTNFQTAQTPQANATPAATTDCQSILTTPSQRHRALISGKRADVGQ